MKRTITVNINTTYKYLQLWNGIFNLTDKELEYAASVFALSADENAARIFIVNPKAGKKAAVMYEGKIVEFGKSNEVFSSPSHPYTQRLLECATL